METLNFNLLSILQIISILQGVVFSYLFIKEYKNKHLFFFGLLLLTLSLGFLPSFLEDTGLKEKYPYLILFPFDFIWLKHILLYIYIQNIPEVKNHNINYHALFFSIFFTSLDIIVFCLPTNLKQLIDSSNIYAIYQLLSIVYSYYFIIITLLFVRKKKKIIQEKFYTADFTEFRWAFYFVFIIVILIFLTFSFSFIFYKFCISNKKTLSLIFTSFDLIIQYVLIIYGLKHKYIQKFIREFISKKKTNPNNNTIEGKELENIIILLNQYLIETNAFKKSNFTIADASAALNIHSKKVSTAINQIKSQNFNSYINTFRIEAAKNMLENNINNNFTIEGIGNMVGFKSKSVFYKEFKEQTGVTPLKYFEKKNK